MMMFFEPQGDSLLERNTLIISRVAMGNAVCYGIIALRRQYFPSSDPDESVNQITFADLNGIKIKKSSSLIPNFHCVIYDVKGKKMMTGKFYLFILQYSHCKIPFKRD